MCITQCMSEECFHIYKGNELEAGEIDERRSLIFEQCAKDQIRTREARRRRGIHNNNGQTDVEAEQEFSDGSSQEEDEPDFPFDQDQHGVGNNVGLDKGAHKVEETT